VTKKRPQKIEIVLERIWDCLLTGKYILTRHAIDRQKERSINLAETLHILKTGYEEKNKTCFDDKQNTWKYAIRGKTILSSKDVRIIIAFEEDGMLVITVMHVGDI